MICRAAKAFAARRVEAGSAKPEIAFFAAEILLLPRSDLRPLPSAYGILECPDCRSGVRVCRQGHLESLCARCREGDIRRSLDDGIALLNGADVGSIALDGDRVVPLGAAGGTAP